MQKIDFLEKNLWLENAINWHNTSHPLRVSNFLPKFDNYVGIMWKVGIIEDFPFEDFIENAKSEKEIKNNRLIWFNFPQAFNDSETGFTEIETEELFKKFKIPFHDYKNDGKLPWNTRAIRVLESKIADSLTKILNNISENDELILYWNDYYRFNIDHKLFKVSKEEYIEQMKQTGFDATAYLYPESRNWCLVNLEDLGYNILAFNDDIKDRLGFLNEIENFKLSKENRLFK